MHGAAFVCFGVVRGGAEEKISGWGVARQGENPRGGAGQHLNSGHFQGTAGQGSLKNYRGQGGRGASLLGISSGIPKQGLWMSIEANKEMTNSRLSPTPVFT